MNYYCGIDPGRQGAIALISWDAHFAKSWDMPEEDQRGVDLAGLEDVFKRLTVYAPKPSILVGVEWNQSRPGEVPDYAFRFGLQTGQIDGLLRGLGFSVEHVSPKAWKPRLGLTGKASDPGSKVAAWWWEQHYPAHKGLIHGPRGGILEGPLDALLIAEYMRRKGESPVGIKGGPRPPKFKGIPGEMLTDLTQWPS
jgi:hypothetical protein